ncbi:disease resistance protein RPP5-like isoform X1 [Prosopis cineraria]|uniref:disease resistance protein RPP5-like isoform X1 n=1 Tax=Prosopis cineraria TaxID=364024 RepID=UPI00240F9021|nr:disease resistance protein RPP5-like isoform X1 [Prosopis cineraria]XP_054780090.1 disease resistance protein RPP5-like isoform X1 [Prosopis cineraria]XP_054780093.1 disease resistance protein RPP5-like isoform X1 [Prosopis cineraria]XP_054780094.1 disease resistance protein RPP5-like isoform X1 [Prosopis cineraria]XP_054780095.1 disease resistance protein RPP5-like isoform X1 [Prosopis cineraria]
MIESNIKKLWDGVQDLVNLKILDLCESKQLTELPDFSRAHNLEVVVLYECLSLRSVHPSILSLHSLEQLDVSHCGKLESLESETHLESLSELNVEGCVSLKKFCLSSEKLDSIDLEDCVKVEKLQVLPMGGFTKLRRLVIEDGERLRSLPIRELCGLTNLEEFKIRNFQQEINTGEMRSLFDAWHNLKELHLDSWSKLSEIPDNIKALSSLKHIFLTNCQGLKSILGLPPSLQELDARDCTSLEIVFSDSLVRNWCQFDFKNCIKLKEDSIHFIGELLTHFSLTSTCKDGLSYGAGARYPGSRVPKWIAYKQITEPSNAIEFTCNLERSPRLLFCCVVPHHLSYRDDFFCDFSYDDKNKFHRTSYFSWDNEDFYPEEMNSDHVVLWHMRGCSFGAEKGDDANSSCKFYMECWNDDRRCLEEVPIKACGVHVTYMLESDSTEERVPPTKKQKTFRYLPTSQLNPTNQFQDDIICHPLQLKFIRKSKQKRLPYIQFL